MEFIISHSFLDLRGGKVTESITDEVQR